VLGTAPAQPVYDDAATYGPWYQHSKMVSFPIFRRFDLQISLIGVPAKWVCRGALTMQLNYSLDVGSVFVDFYYDTFNIMTPGVLVTKWS
jgi:hypothetical protein